MQGDRLWIPPTTSLSSGEVCGNLHTGPGLARQVMARLTSPPRAASQKTQYREGWIVSWIQRDTSYGLVSWCKAGQQRKHRHTPLQEGSSCIWLRVLQPSFSGSIWWEDRSVRKQAMLAGEAAGALTGTGLPEHSPSSGSAAKPSPQNRLSIHASEHKWHCCSASVGHSLHLAHTELG